MNMSARAEAIRRAKEYLAQQPVFLDTETTGIGPNAEIVEISVVDFDGTVLVDTLVKPRGAIELGAQRVHGITAEMLDSAPGWDVVWPEVKIALAERAVGIFNADFDTRMMQQSHQLNRMQWQQPKGEYFCVMRLYAQFYGQWNSRRGSYRWQSLENARAQCRLQTPNSHRALDDTRLAREVLLYMAAARA
ncbi:MAG: 3'-5' exonuclease [Chloroflexi bacterium]|jgi:DNA polymerase III subunit epsilon|nr:3'-5' exonuclease [Chloroflexota bacterium]